MPEKNFLMVFLNCSTLQDGQSAFCRPPDYVILDLIYIRLWLGEKIDIHTHPPNRFHYSQFKNKKKLIKFVGSTLVIVLIGGELSSRMSVASITCAFF